MTDHDEIAEQIFFVNNGEITLLIPVVFLILPVSISFAIWPSIYGLNQAGL
jgi:hypothetical protein